jgi:hypothetical protein
VCVSHSDRTHDPMGLQPNITMHSVPGADLSDWDDYEINLDQRVLSPEICMAACMAGRPAGWR